MSDRLPSQVSFSKLRAQAERIRAHLFFYGGAFVLGTAAFVLVTTTVAGGMTWAGLGMVALSAGVGTVMHLIGRWLRRKTTTGVPS